MGKRFDQICQETWILKLSWLHFNVNAIVEDGNMWLVLSNSEGILEIWAFERNSIASKTADGSATSHFSQGFAGAQKGCHGPTDPKTPVVFISINQRLVPSCKNHFWTTVWQLWGDYSTSLLISLNSVRAGGVKEWIASLNICILNRNRQENTGEKYSKKGGGGSMLVAMR